MMLLSLNELDNIFPYQALISWPLWVHQVSQVSHLMTVLSSSVNYYIYLAKHRMGRAAIQVADSPTENMSLDTVANTQVSEHFLFIFY